MSDNLSIDRVLPSFAKASEGVARVLSLVSEQTLRLHHSLVEYRKLGTGR